MIGDNLNPSERHELLMAPVYLSLLASVKDGEIKDSEREAGIKLTDLRSRHSGDAELNEYYSEVNKEYTAHFDRVSTMLPAETHEKTAVLGEHMAKAKEIIDKLPEGQKLKLIRSLKSLAGRIEKADRNLFQYFFVPFGISEDDDENNYDNQGPETRHYAP